MTDPNRLITLISELHLLARKAQAHSDEHADDNPLSHYWRGLKVGYEDAAQRAELLLRSDEQ